MTSFLNTQGILHRVICPYTHHQNGVVEHKHKHIIELGFTLLKKVSLPLKIWEFSFTRIVFLINRLLVKFNRFNNRLPNLMLQSLSNNLDIWIIF